MTTNATITQWIEQLKDGDAVAAEELWHRYFRQIVRLAGMKLEGANRAAADEEDVALSAFKSLCLGAKEGRFPKLADRDSLWSLLMAITAHKSVDLLRHENRQKRGGTGAASSDDRDAHCDRMNVIPLSQIIECDPTPEFATEIGEQLTLLLKKLEEAKDPDLLHIANAKMLGHSTAEVAQQLGCVRRTVERKVRLIRRIWEKEVE